MTIKEAIGEIKDSMHDTQARRMAITALERIEIIRDIANTLAGRKMSVYMSSSEMRSANHKGICQIADLLSDE